MSKGKKTAGVEELVTEVLGTIPKPYGEDIIKEVFIHIENNPSWRETYENLCIDLRQWVVNNWIGKYTKLITGYNTSIQVNTKHSNLTKSYSKLTS